MYINVTSIIISSTCVYIYIHYLHVHVPFKKKPMNFHMWMRKKPCLSRNRSPTEAPGVKLIIRGQGSVTWPVNMGCDLTPGKSSVPGLVNRQKTMRKPWKNHGKMMIYMENHHVLWVNQLFLWSFSIAMLNYQRV